MHYLKGTHGGWTWVLKGGCGGLTYTRRASEREPIALPNIHRPRQMLRGTSLVQGWVGSRSPWGPGRLRGCILTQANWLVLHVARSLKKRRSSSLQALLWHLSRWQLMWHRVCTWVRMEP